MTSVDARTRAPATARSEQPVPLSVRARMAVPLLIGAALVLLLLEPIGSLPVRGWVPIIIGLSYVAAGLLSGRRGLLVAPGLVIAVWGIAPMSVNYGYEFNGMFYLTLGTGLLAAALLAERGWHIPPMSLALPVLFMGAVMAIAPRAGDSLTTILAVLLVGWALWELRPRTRSTSTVAE
jgi:hypothetical protein